MRTMRTAAPAAGNGKEGKFDPSTWAGQARQLARNEADAAALLWGLALAALAAVVVAVALLAGMPAKRVLSADLVFVGAGLLAAVALIWLYSYASALRADTQAVRMATWQREMALGMDLDGDGAVGQPAQAPEPAGHVVQVNGRPLVLPDVGRPRDEPPLIHFPICANDVIFVVNRAATVGLGFRAWDKQKLPSRQEIDRALWGKVIDGLVAWQFATATVDAAGKRRAALRQDVDVDEMLHAVRRGAGEG